MKRKMDVTRAGLRLRTPWTLLGALSQLYPLARYPLTSCTRCATYLRARYWKVVVGLF